MAFGRISNLTLATQRPDGWTGGRIQRADGRADIEFASADFVGEFGEAIRGKRVQFDDHGDHATAVRLVE